MPFSRGLVALALAVAVASVAHATPIVPNSTGLAGLPGVVGPIRLLDFETPPPGVAHNQPLLGYDDFGVNFTNIWYNTVDYTIYFPPTNLPFPNQSGAYISNYFCSGNCGAPILEQVFTIIPDFTIGFDVPVSAVAFSFFTNPDDSPGGTGAALLKAFNGPYEIGSIVAYSTTDKFATNNYYGFTGQFFDRIEIEVFSNDLSGHVDNLQFVVAIPEPSTCVLLTLGLLGLAARRRIGRRAVAMAA